MKPDDRPRTATVSQLTAWFRLFLGGTTGYVVLRHTFRADVAAPRAARAALAESLVHQVARPVIRTAELLVSELVSNSVRHARIPVGSSLEVSTEVTGDVLRVEVFDPGSGRDVAPRTPDIERGGGFGLLLVERLARRWGAESGSGTRVWFELAA
jgi:anti-sigma regulatory factor (Ser/Thr protein kinase)